MFHADRGTQYTSAQLNDVCTGLGIRQSVGRTGVCWDNAMQESFWSTLKAEFYNRRRWTPRQDASNRPLDRGVLQPGQAPLRPGLYHPCGTRTIPHHSKTSDGKSRLTNCPRFAGNLIGKPRRANRS
ncbi:integrase core domain-containing protein [Arthrobacter sp. ISL-28]|uniref:integrase core domain-containing protein n=1 Tax=Arthrobacter sp. ISL-28 TaxID=2819108 RepID=UPI001BE7FE14|nr:DDE-type integrase/transposase/recombinase [Arthrobacter sp. ISL-28]